jgi:putative transposase
MIAFALCATSSSWPPTCWSPSRSCCAQVGVRAVAAESLILRHQLLISNRSWQRAPNLTSIDRFVLDLTTLFVSPRRIPKLGALIKPATLINFHKALVDRQYRLLFSSSSHRRKLGPKDTSAELIAAIVEMKRRNPRFGCVRIAQQISHAFEIKIDKDVVRRVLAKHYGPGASGATDPSCLTSIGHAKDSLCGFYGSRQGLREPLRVRIRSCGNRLTRRCARCDARG